MHISIYIYIYTNTTHIERYIKQNIMRIPTKRHTYCVKSHSNYYSTKQCNQSDLNKMSDNKIIFG